MALGMCDVTRRKVWHKSGEEQRITTNRCKHSAAQLTTRRTATFWHARGGSCNYLDKTLNQAFFNQTVMSWAVIIKRDCDSREARAHPQMLARSVQTQTCVVWLTGPLHFSFTRLHGLVFGLLWFIALICCAYPSWNTSQVIAERMSLQRDQHSHSYIVLCFDSWGQVTQVLLYSLQTLPFTRLLGRIFVCG